LTSNEYVVTMNGRTSTLLAGADGRSLEEELVHRLGVLDGVTRFALMLWRLPDGVEFDDVDLKKYPTEYLQCAGAFDGRMTCEIRVGDARNGVRCVLGAPGATAEQQLIERIPWNGCQEIVAAGEVLASGEVTELFLHYYRTRDAPDAYVRRPV
jgi:hypothetical protein